MSQAERVKRKKFNDDHIRRGDLPMDAFLLIHDLAYDHEGRDRRMYRYAAQRILSSLRDLRHELYTGWEKQRKGAKIMTHLNTEDQIEQLMEQDEKLQKLHTEMVAVLRQLVAQFDSPMRNTNRGYRYAEAVCISSDVKEEVRRILEGYNCVVAERESRKI